LISYSLDQTIKIWMMHNAVVNQKKQYEDYPTTIFDHEAQILSADVLKSSSWTDGSFHLFASIDVTGKILIRNLYQADKIENVIRKIVIPINLIYPKSGDQDNDDDDDGMDSEYSLFKRNTIKLLFT